MSRSVVLIVLVSLMGCASARRPDPQAPGPIASKYQAVAARLITSVKQHNDAYAKLEKLCDDIGHRLSGSEGLDRGIRWAVRTLQADGQENVHTEVVMVPRWVRGAESLTLVEPRPTRVAMLGLGGSVGTPPEGITTEIVAVADEEELEALGDGARGKIVLFDNAMPQYDSVHGSGYGRTVRFRSKGARLASEYGAVACLIRSVTATSLRSPHTGAMNYGDAEVKIPAAAISTEDAAMISRLRARGVSVTATLRMEARTEEPVSSANVIAELRGSANPDEVVVISGHFDSWDVGQGAHDDGGGCVVAMETLNVLRRLNLIPRRTIRVVLWTNEENGRAGARRYAEEHAAELAQHVAAIEADSGTFRPRGFSIEMNDDEKVQVAAEQLGDLLRLLTRLGATDVATGWSGADISTLKPAGVPLLGLRVDGSRYFDYHHTQADTLDKVDPQDLTDCVAAMAVVAYVLADMPGRLGEKGVVAARPFTEHASSGDAPRKRPSPAAP
ncbi:MAG: M20/M25/M40 family metallo-hydrolase [Planctomycetota bacterium]|jgi:carboxypeptidase Q